MSFGITASGFVIKRLTDIKAELEDSFRGAFGKSVNLDSRTPEGQLIGTLSERESLLWELLEQLYNSQYPDTAEDVPLDNVVAITGTQRKAATKSTVTATIFGTPAVVVPNTFIVFVENNSDARFKLKEPVTIAAGVDEVQTISYSAVPTSGQFSLSYNLNETTPLDFDATLGEIESALEALEGITNVVVTGTFAAGHVITFTGDSGSRPFDLLVEGSVNTLDNGGPVTISIVETTAGVFAKVDGLFEAVEAGSTSAPAESLTQIETPVSGVASVSNALDAVIGDDVETNAALKIRREQEIAQAGKATVDAIRAALSDIPDVTASLVFQNNGDVTDGFGRPPHSIDCVVEGGVDQAIGEEIFNTMGAGIGLFGDIDVVVVDDQGFNQNIKFSRPTQLLIYCEVDLTTNVNFPANGLTLVEQAIIDYGLGLNIGDDVIVYTPLVSAIGTVPGITDLVIRIGTAASPTLDDNIVVGVREKAVFDSSRITVTEL